MEGRKEGRNQAGKKGRMEGRRTRGVGVISPFLAAVQTSAGGCGVDEEGMRDWKSWHSAISLPSSSAMPSTRSIITAPAASTQSPAHTLSATARRREEILAIKARQHEDGVVMTEN